MEIIQKKCNEDESSVVELVKDDKHLKFSLSKYDELSLEFSYDDKNKGNLFQERFDIGKEDGDVYKSVDGIFLSYSGDVYFDTLGANLILLNEGNKYSFFFMKEFDQGANEVTSKFFNDCIENSSMKLLFERLQGLESKEEYKEEKPKMLSKTLQKIVEK